MKVSKLLLFLVSLVLISAIVLAPGAVDIIPDQPHDSDNLTCLVGGSTSNNYQYKWYNNGVEDTAETSWTFPASKTNVYDYVLCAAYAPQNFLVGIDAVIILSDQVNLPPEVTLTMPQDGATFNVGDEIQFIAEASDPDGYFVIAWGFGDNSDVVVGELNPTHTYNTPGQYEVLVVVGDGQFYDSDSITINIEEILVNQLPVAVIDSLNTVGVGDVVFFDGSNSFDPDGVIINYEWIFSDGFNVFGPGATWAQHSFDEPGEYLVVLIVTDNDGAIAGTSKVITVVPQVENQPPVADAGSDKATLVNEAVNFDGSNSFDTDGNIINYEWNFGDGDTGQGSLVDHVYTEEGVYVVSLTVTDNDGAINTDWVLVDVTTVLGSPTAVINVDSTNVFLGFSLNFDGSNSFDTDGNIINYEWNFGDGDTGQGSLVDHVYTEEGVYVVSLTVTDNDGLTDSETVEINAGNVDRGPDFDKQRINPSGNERDLSIGKVMPLQNKLFYNKGETVLFLVKLTNEGKTNENVDLELLVSEFNVKSNLNNIYLGSGDINWVMVSMTIPSNAQSGLHLAKFSITPNDNNNFNDINYLQFIVN